MQAGNVQSAQKTEKIQKVKKALEKIDAVGSFNSYGSKLWGSFLVKDENCENIFRNIDRESMSSITFTILNQFNDGERIQKCLTDWAKGD